MSVFLLFCILLESILASTSSGWSSNNWLLSFLFPGLHGPDLTFSQPFSLLLDFTLWPSLTPEEVSCFGPLQFMIWETRGLLFTVKKCLSQLCSCFCSLICFRHPLKLRLLWLASHHHFSHKVSQLDQNSWGFTRTAGSGPYLICQYSCQVCALYHRGQPYHQLASWSQDLAEKFSNFMWAKSCGVCVPVNCCFNPLRNWKLICNHRSTVWATRPRSWRAPHWGYILWNRKSFGYHPLTKKQLIFFCNIA